VVPGKASGSDLLGDLSEALERQRAALVARDAEAVRTATEAVAAAVAALRAGGRIAGADDTRLAAVRSVLRANAELLERSGAGNARALAALFDSPDTYGPGGTGGLNQPTRRIDSA
jgi:hypothetical protein